MNCSLPDISHSSILQICFNLEGMFEKDMLDRLQSQERMKWGMCENKNENE